MTPSAPVETPHSPDPCGRCVWSEVFGTILFGLGLAALGGMQFIFRDFLPGRAPAWPEQLPGRIVVSYLSGILLVATGASIIRLRPVRACVITAATMIVVWSLARLIPPVLRDTWLGGSWTHFGKALVFTSGLIVVAPSAWRIPAGYARWVGCIALGGFMILAGLQHFRWMQFVATLVPGWVPGGGVFWTYASAGLLLAGGLGMLIPRLRQLAAFWSGVMIFLWVFMLHLPRAFARNDQNEWTAVAEATAFSGLAFVLASPGQGSLQRFMRRSTGEAAPASQKTN